MYYTPIVDLYFEQENYDQEETGAFSARETIPIVGNISALYNICIKASLKNEDITNNHYYEFINDMSYFTLIVYTIPILGNVVAAFNYYKRKKTISEKASALSKLQDSESVHEFFEDLKSWEKAAVARKAISRNGAIYKHLPEQVKLRYDVVIQAMLNGVPETEIADRLRNDRTLMLSAVYRLGIHLKYASESLRAEDHIIESYLTRLYDMRFCRRTDPVGQLQHLPIEKIEKLLAQGFKINRNLVSPIPMNLGEVLYDLGPKFIQNLSAEDQKNLLSQIFFTWRSGAVFLQPDDQMSFFSREVVQEFLHENGGTYRHLYTPEMWLTLNEYRSSPASSVSDKSQNGIPGRPELENEYS